MKKISNKTEFILNSDDILNEVYGMIEKAVIDEVKREGFDNIPKEELLEDFGKVYLWISGMKPTLKHCYDFSEYESSLELESLLKPIYDACHMAIIQRYFFFRCN